MLHGRRRDDRQHIESIQEVLGGYGVQWMRRADNRLTREVLAQLALFSHVPGGAIPHQMPFHLKRALDNGVMRDELVEAITHLAFYAGWPVASTGLFIARRVFGEAGV